MLQNPITICIRLQITNNGMEWIAATYSNAAVTTSVMVIKL